MPKLESEYDLDNSKVVFQEVEGEKHLLFFYEVCWYGNIIVEELNSILVQMSNLSIELYGEDYDRIESEVDKMIKTYIDPEIYRKGMIEGIKEGMKEGIREGKAKILLKQLSKRVGILSDDLSERIMKLNEETLERIADDIFDIKSIEDLTKYLKQ